jgi:adenosylcobinamide-phosphate synthase
VSYPDRLVRAIGHPVIWMGRLIGALDRWLNRDGGGRARAFFPPPCGEGSGVGVGGSGTAVPSPLAPPPRPSPARGEGARVAVALRRRAAGGVALVVLVGVAAAIALVLERGFMRLPLGLLWAAILASTLIAQRSLHDYVSRVASALEAEGLAAGREAVSHIVGRDTRALDEAGVARAAIESLAENFSDGVVAPAFWLAVAGLSGAAAYKAVNTADSMIGHRTPRHLAFGWAAARLDDLVNLPASRLSALLIIAAAAIGRWLPPPLAGEGGEGASGKGGAAAAEAWRAVIRDAPRHRSPNAGYPEAAMAGALGLSLAGPRVYGGVEIGDAFMGCGRRAATAADIRAALALYRRADAILIGLAGIVMLMAAV